MTPRKLSVFFAFFCYTGNSTGTSLVWSVADWYAKSLVRLRTDAKLSKIVEHVSVKHYADTPITMTRNQAVRDARAEGCDILIMVDSDMHPDVHFGEYPDAVPFLDTALDEIYRHYDRGPLVVGAPYGGAPPHENMFVFTWSSKGNLGDEAPFELRQYTREEAIQLGGVQECAALPTGLIAYDLRVFDYIDAPYFNYEWNADATEKQSTEDVQNTRDISLAVQHALGYNPLLCTWSSWAGHYKVWCVRKPYKYTASDVASNLSKALARTKKEQVVDLSHRLHEVGLTLPSNFGDEFEDAVNNTDEPLPAIRQHHWGPWKRAIEFAERKALAWRNVVEVGPGNIPFSPAKEFVGRRADGVDYPGEVHEIDLDRDALPFNDGAVDYLYCRHTLEDLNNPEHLLREIARVARGGFIETPSPIAECCRGVDAPGSQHKGRGYIHHRSLLWSYEGVLYVLPKFPAINDLQLDEVQLVELLNQSPAFWNTYHVWEGELKFKVLRHEIDFSVNTGYISPICDALRESQISINDFISHINRESPRHIHAPPVVVSNGIPLYAKSC